MKKLRRLTAGLALAAATATGYALTDHMTAPTGDTAWGAPATTDDTAWGTPPVDVEVDVTVVTPLDTAWG